MPQHEQQQEHASCDLPEEFFVDVDFPADCRFLTEDAPEAVEWRRPHEICDEPRLFVDGISRQDVLQGNIGNCWSMAASTAMADHPELVKRVIPDGQILQGPGYTGRIIIRLWHMGSWRDIEIDDRLPMFSGELLYARNTKNEFWMPLVEKALAKFHGGYQNLTGGLLPEGFINLTGYSVRLLYIEEYKEKKNSLFYLLDTEIKNNSLIACARGGKFERGLPDYHGFTVTGVSHLRTDKHRVRLVRVRNPWGDDEWNGKWRDDHDVWKELGPELWDKMEYRVRIDGEFWMKLVDFIKYFEELCIASRMPSVDEKNVLPATHSKLIRGSWSGDSSGGSWNGETFHLNPQFLIDVEEVTQLEIDAYTSGTTQNEEEQKEMDSEEEIHGKCNEILPPTKSQNESDCIVKGLPILIELLQDHNRRQGKIIKIGFHVFQIENTDSQLTPYTPEQLQTFPQLRPGDPYDEVLSAIHGYYHLTPSARYLVVPYATETGEARRFLLRVYTRHAHIHMHQLTEADDRGNSDDSQSTETVEP